MARQGKYLHADSLIEAIRQASDLVDDPIERIEVVGPLIHVTAGGHRMVFRITQSHSIDPITRIPTLGGASGGVTLERRRRSWWSVLQGRRRTSGD